MMAVSRGTRRVGRSGAAARPRRKFVWARQTVNLTVAAESVGTANLLTNFETLYGAQLIGCTVTRIRGFWIANPASASDTVASVWGIRVDTVAGQGPADEPHADWMSYTPIVLQTGGSAGTDANLQTRMGEVDVRSQRRVEELNESLFLYVNNEIVGVAMDFVAHLSIGLKLP